MDVERLLITGLLFAILYPWFRVVVDRWTNDEEADEVDA